MIRLGMLLGLLVWLFVVPDVHGQPRIPRIGLLSVGTDPARPLPPQWIAFFEGLRQLGYVDGQGIVVDRRFAGGQSERVSGFAAELVERNVDVIVVTGMREVQAAHGATTTLLREAVPKVTRVAVLASRPPDPTEHTNMRDAARVLNVELLPLSLVKKPDDFEAFFAQARRDGVGGVVVPSDGFINIHRRLVVDLAAKYRLPAIYTVREFVDHGGLMAYGPSFVDLFRRAPIVVDKVLKGARPAELPVEQPTKFELLVNLKTARTLGLALSQSLLARADEVIQ